MGAPVKNTLLFRIRAPQWAVQELSSLQKETGIESSKESLAREILSRCLQWINDPNPEAAVPEILQRLKRHRQNQQPLNDVEQAVLNKVKEDPAGVRAIIEQIAREEIYKHKTK